MKTKNVFELTATSVTMKVFDVSAFNKGDDTSNAPLLAEHTFDASVIPAELEDGDNVNKSLVAYGLSRLMQDRSSDFTDGKLGETGASAQEVAETRLAAYIATYEHLLDGQFKVKRAKSETRSAVDTFFAQGLVDFLSESGKNMDINTATVYLQQRNNEERKALRAKLQPHINAAREKARKAASELNLDDLLG